MQRDEEQGVANLKKALEAAPKGELAPSINMLLRQLDKSREEAGRRQSAGAGVAAGTVVWSARQSQTNWNPFYRTMSVYDPAKRSSGRMLNWP